MSRAIIQAPIFFFYFQTTPPRLQDDWGFGEKDKQGRNPAKRKHKTVDGLKVRRVIQTLNV